MIDASPHFGVLLQNECGGERLLGKLSPEHLCLNHESPVPQGRELRETS
jgi:hypothetical protein